MQLEFWKSTGHTSDASEMCGSAERTIWNPLTLSAEAFPARTSALQGDGRDWLENDLVFGTSLLASFASLGPDGCWLKTCQGYCQRTMEGQWLKFSGTWPRAGTMRAGTVYRRQPLVPLTAVIGFSLWPTPRVSMANGPSQKEVDAGNPKRRIETEIAITDGGGQLNPTWVELLMGFPMGWTDLDG